MSLYWYFLLTVVIEVPVIILMVSGNMKEKILIAFLLNLFTWPLLHVLFYYTNMNIYFMEISIAVTEGVGYWLFFKNTFVKSIVAGFVANGLSYGIGLLIQQSSL